MSSVPKTHTRVGIFTATEVQVEAMPGEWIRDDEASTEPVTTKMNDFLDQSGSRAVFVSPPTIDLRAVSDDGDRRTYFTSVSLIYVPEESVYDESNADDFSIPEAVLGDPAMLAALSDSMGSASVGMLPADLTEKIIAKLSADKIQEINTQNAKQARSQKARSQKSRKQRQAKVQPEEARAMDGDVPLRGKSNVRSVPKLPRLS